MKERTPRDAWRRAQGPTTRCPVARKRRGRAGPREAGLPEGSSGPEGLEAHARPARRRRDLRGGLRGLAGPLQGLRTSERDNRGGVRASPLFSPGLSLSDNYRDSEASRKRSEEDSGTHCESDFSVSGCLLIPPETYPDPVSGRFVALRSYLRKRGFGMPKGGVTTL